MPKPADEAGDPLIEAVPIPLAFDANAPAPPKTNAARTSNDARTCATANPTELEPARERALIAAAQSGDTGAFEQLVLAYQDRIYRLCLRKLGCREDALEASQETFLRAWRAIGRFQGHARWYTWLFRIAINCSYSLRSRRARRLERQTQALDEAHHGSSAEPATRELGPLARTLQREQAERIACAISELPELYQNVVVLRDLEGMRYEQIAEILDLPLGSVKSRLHRARLALREALTDLWSPANQRGTKP